MSDHGYEKGRLNLPFVGICTFGNTLISLIGIISMLILLY